MRWWLLANCKLRLLISSSFKKRVVKNATLSFWYFDFGNFNVNFVENFMKKPILERKPFLRQFSKVLLKFYHVTIFKDLTTLDSKMVVILLFTLKMSLLSWYSHKIPGWFIRCFATTIEKFLCIVIQKQSFIGTQKTINSENSQENVSAWAKF